MSDAAPRPNDSPSTPVETASDAPDLTGTTLGDFRVLRLLGQGGMGQVYLAEQISLKRQVALKMLKPELAAQPRSLERFQREAEAVARATHANILQVYTTGAADGVHYMALEFVEGRNLREYLEKKGTPELPFGLRIMTQVAAALQRANELGIVHRDIKPENILLTRKGEVKVTDFGLSRVFSEEKPLSLTQSGVTMGTPLYMSPEQVEGKQTVDHRSDIYSFGVTCYHMFAGHPPFRGTSPFEVAIQHVQKEPEPLQEIRPDLPADLCSIIHKMMAKQPQTRYQTAREILRDVNRLRDLLSIAGTTALGPTMFGSGSAEALDAVRPTAGRRRRRALLLAAVPVALCAGLALGWAQHRPAAVPGNGSGPVLPPEDEAPAVTRFSSQEVEKELVKFFQQYGKPGGTKLDEATALTFAIDLGLFYLREGRYDDAEKFFKELDPSDQKVPVAHRFYGRLGKAMVHAFKNETKVSNEQFVALMDKFGDKLPGPGGPFWKSNPRVREMLARALQFNLANSPETFPDRLRPYLHPPVPANMTAKKNGG